MKKGLLIGAFFALLAFSAGASAQVTNFGGTWILDVSKSKLDERARIESQTLTVTQTDKDIKVETATKRLPPPADAPQGMGGRMGGGFGPGDAPMTYTLDGKETKIEQQGPMGSVPVTLKAKFDGAKLVLSSSRTFTGPMGEVTSTSKETWELSADGKALTVNKENTSPRGTNTSTMVYSKKN